ncbi:ATP-grasp fold amidoligase family protein [Dehalobacterium formicoaceticum]|uniref:ATP-grasp fold amidoligase family protein n=1 Tax=Dehalobacterium formicoaceticum TaxID=51515 RepID=UPI000B7F98DC|nr:ATP-grasp fold amidoligase family protein [Dehalobacterium formicoaceticum]
MSIRKYLFQPKEALKATCAKGYFDFLSDRTYLKLIYWLRMGKVLNLNNPQTFNEKLQWLKLYDRCPEYTMMVDKYEAKKYVAERIGGEYIIPTLGVWDKFEDIDFGLLPNQFVMKCTHDSGGLVIVREKGKMDIEVARKKINASLNKNYFWGGREWPYKNVKPRIIAEQYLENSSKGLRDYKFFNFNGVPQFTYVSEGMEDHSTAKISFYDFDRKKMEFHRTDYAQFCSQPEFPSNMDEMKRLSAELAQIINCPFVRTDFYSVDNKVFFSEITFSPCSGMIPFEPAEWDKKLGEWIKLPK